MNARHFLVLTLAALTLPAPALAQDADPAVAAAAPETRFILAAPAPRAAWRAPAIRPAVRAQQAMPRELPAVLADDALPPPVLTWRPARGAVLKVKPAKLRFNWDF